MRTIIVFLSIHHAHFSSFQIEVHYYNLWRFLTCFTIIDCSFTGINEFQVLRAECCLPVLDISTCKTAFSNRTLAPRSRSGVPVNPSFTAAKSHIYVTSIANYSITSSNSATACINTHEDMCVGTSLPCFLVPLLAKRADVRRSRTSLFLPTTYICRRRMYTVHNRK